MFTVALLAACCLAPQASAKDKQIKEENHVSNAQPVSGTPPGRTGSGALENSGSVAGMTGIFPGKKSGPKKTNAEINKACTEKIPGEQYAVALVLGRGMSSCKRNPCCWEQFSDLVSQVAENLGIEEYEPKPGDDLTKKVREFIVYGKIY